ncbi:hypothetical protein B0T10DRAFT_490231 [Thelonectria olida]|uniref:Uncharacterized protein n=1 Tax=Thelonectria olida TaxID=1576542 RepID=A0A9P8W4Q6_9HYPO|nr:hypothetical protein B0T10DRAFT_490231 [Thelonectria olida]
MQLPWTMDTQPGLSSTMEDEVHSILLDYDLEIRPSATPKAIKKRTRFIWTCCLCACDGMRISVGYCPGCGLPRCAYCRVEKITICADS